jgi:hypothetical protein
MKTVSTPRRGKIMVHQQGFGDLAQADIERRARELARIDGRRRVSVQDRERAGRELRGEALPSTSEVEVTSRRALSRDPSEPPSDFGREIPAREGADESKVPERLVLEGVEEAQHEQMLASQPRRRRRR